MLLMQKSRADAVFSEIDLKSYSAKVFAPIERRWFSPNG